MSFQWFKNDAPIPGANAACLRIADAQTSDTGSYHAAMIGARNEVTSDAAVVTVEACDDRQ